MTYPTPDTPREPVDSAALSILAERLRDSEFRVAFRQDPNQAMQSYGVPSLPQDLVTHLGALTDQELTFIGEETAFFKQFPINCHWL